MENLSARCHRITTKALRTLILDTIRTVSTFAISNQEAFMEKVRSASKLRLVCAHSHSRRAYSHGKACKPEYIRAHYLIKLEYPLHVIEQVAYKPADYA